MLYELTFCQITDIDLAIQVHRDTAEILGQSQDINQKRVLGSHRRSLDSCEEAILDINTLINANLLPGRKLSSP